MKRDVELLLLGWTAFLEAGGEPAQGQLAVAYVICNRAKGGPISTVVFAPNQFECWNTGTPARQHISQIDYNGLDWQSCLFQATAAYDKTVDDPTVGALYYMNETLVIQRADHLPQWWLDLHDPGVVIGKQRFRRGN